MFVNTFKVQKQIMTAYNIKIRNYSWTFYTTFFCFILNFFVLNKSVFFYISGLLDHFIFIIVYMKDTITNFFICVFFFCACIFYDFKLSQV